LPRFVAPPGFSASSDLRNEATHLAPARCGARS
jgi:hypothetical protein